MEHVTDIEHFSALMLTALSTLSFSVKRARHLLACDDLPVGIVNPSLVLSSAHRVRLQFDCLHRQFQKTSLGCNLTLLYMVVKRCIADGTVESLLSDLHSSNFYEIATNVMVTAALPDSSLHRAWHQFDPTAPLTRSQSHTDLTTNTTCVCPPSTEDEKDMMQSMMAEMRDLRISMNPPSDDDDPDYDDYDTCNTNGDDTFDPAMEDLD
jgi:hypothetical protein